MKISSVTAKMILSGLVSVASTVAYGGDGRNGPVMSGEAIPRLADRAITQEVGERAVLKCSRKVLIDLHDQIFPDKNKKFAADDGSTNRAPKVHFASCDNPSFSNQPVEGPVCAYPNIYIYDTQKRGVGIESRFIGITPDSNNTYYFVSEYTRDGSLTPIPLPYLKFDRTITDRRMDRLGFIASVSSILKKPGLKLGPQRLAPISLVNPYTGAQGIGAINVEKYVKCMVGEIQRP